MATYLVTGGCGFIGAHLCAALRARGDDVVVLDDLSSGRLENLAPGARLIRGSITDGTIVAAALDGVDGCFHLAAIASVERAVQDWRGTHAVNLTGTIVLLDAISRRKAGAVPFVYASSAAVYGDGAALPITEDGTKAPLSPYGADKYGCELQAAVASRLHGISTVGFRFFNVYGPRQHPRSPYSGVISIFGDRLLRGEPVTIFGDGGQTRDFVFVRDVVAALLRGMMAPPAPPAAAVYNVCTGRPTSVLDLARLIGELAGNATPPKLAAARSGEIRHSVGSPAALAAGLGVFARTSLRVGLAETLAWVAADRDSPKWARAG